MDEFARLEDLGRSDGRDCDDADRVCSDAGEQVRRYEESGVQSDVQGFFSHVDKTKVGDSITNAALAQAAAGAPKGGLAGAGAKLGGQLAKSMMPAVVAAAFTGWEDDIKKGRRGTSAT